MGIPTNLKTLLSGNVVEWARIEFKETWDPEASLKTICAFANDIDNWGGGYLVIGVKDTRGAENSLPGVPVGQVDSWLKDLLNKCKRIQPEYMPITEVAEYQGKKFIVVWAPGGSVRPYSSPKNMGKDCKERICWIRKMASTIVPSAEELRDLYSLANNIPFDDRVNHQAELADLNITLIQQYLKEVGSGLYKEAAYLDFETLCANMNLISTLPEYAKPKNVALMFFSMTPEKFFPYAQIDVVQFPDDLGGDQIIEKTFKGPLHQQLREALQYIRNSIITEYVQKLPDVAEANRYFNYPYAAIEEALSNAVYHKGYDIREPIEVRVLPDKIEILSHPGADRSISIAGLKSFNAVSRRYRNRRVGEFLKELHLTEGRNTGFRKIIRALKANGSPTPIFETDEERTYFLTTIPVRSDINSVKAPIHDRIEKTGLQEQKQASEEAKTGLQEQKQASEEAKTGLQEKNRMIEVRIFGLKTGAPTKENITKVFLYVGFGKEFARADVMKITGLTATPASELMRKMKNAGLILPTQTRGKYQFAEV